MQKLTEALDWNRGDPCTKKEMSQQKNETYSLSVVTSEVITLKSFRWKAQRVCL